MAKFTTRVELYGNASWDDYERLHAAMKREGFYQTISYEGDPTEWHLPSAEYNRGANLTTEEILNSARKAAESVWTSVGILVTKADGPRSIYNLRRA